MRDLLLRSALCVAAAIAPLQCPSAHHPAEREDPPAQAVWELAERLGQRGDEPGRREALRFLVERYPDSRYAERARMDLGDAGTAGTERAAATRP